MKLNLNFIIGILIILGITCFLNKKQIHLEGFDNTPSGSPNSSTPSSSTPSGSTPSGSTPSGSTPSGSTPSGSTPSGSTPSGSDELNDLASILNNVNELGKKKWRNEVSPINEENILKHLEEMGKSLFSLTNDFHKVKERIGNNANENVKNEISKNTNAFIVVISDILDLYLFMSSYKVEKNDEEVTVESFNLGLLKVKTVIEYIIPFFEILVETAKEVELFNQNVHSNISKVEARIKTFKDEQGISDGSSPVSSSPGVSSSPINEELLIEELLNILDSLNKSNLSDDEKSKIRESLDNIEKIIVNADLSQFSDSNKFSMIMKLLTQNRKLLNKNSDAVELEAIRSTFGTGGGSRGAQNYANTPHLPSISQFKPTGTSNIFSPVIEVKSSPYRNNNNRRYSNAYEKGFEKGMRRAQATLGETNIIDQSTQISDTTVQQQITGGDTTYDKSFRGVNVGNKTNVGYTDSEGEKSYKERNSQSKSSTSDNGYIRKDNGREIQKPGYSYLDPRLWSIPRKRTPICFSSGDMERKENSLDPAGFVFGGPSNVMEFHGVGSILPKFSYNEQVNEVETQADI